MFCITAYYVYCMESLWFVREYTESLSLLKKDTCSYNTGYTESGTYIYFLNIFSEMKDLLFKMWYDTTKPNQVALLLGDYHQLGIWMQPGGRVVAFDPAPTLEKGALTKQRITKGTCYNV